MTKNKGFFPNDTALEKLVHLAYTRISRKWTMPMPNWGQMTQQLADVEAIRTGRKGGSRHV